MVDHNIRRFMQKTAQNLAQNSHFSDFECLVPDSPNCAVSIENAGSTLKKGDFLRNKKRSKDKKHNI